MPRPERPLDPFAGPVEQFAFDLRQLREKAGSPGYRELGKLTHYSASTLADAARGQRLPSLAVALAFVRACGGDEQVWEERWRAIGESTTVEEGSAPSPYVGLKAFTQSDADRFFGRERLLGKLLDKLEQHNTVLVIGASGSGKSSLLRAGLLTRQPGTLITPGSHPEFPEVDGLLVVDQFEEIFALPTQDKQDAFVTALTTRSEKTVIGMRADFYGHCARHPALVAAIEDAQVLVGPMTTDELRRAITQPAVEVGCALETGLVARLIADATGEPGVLPHVSHALLETWQRKRGNTLTLASYHESGGIARAIANTAEHAYTGLSEDQQRQARQLLLRLITPGEGTEDTKRRVSRSEVSADDVIEHFAAARILTVADDGVEISHEAVIRSWPRLREWLSEARDDLRLHRKLTAAAADWVAHGRDPGSLLRGAPLDQATDWARREPGALNAQEQAFLDASTATAINELTTAKRRTTNLRRMVALLTVLLLVATTATVFAVRAQRQATEQQTLAYAQKAIAEATGLQDSDPALAAQLRLAAYRITGLPEARDALLSTFTSPFVTRVTAHPEGASYAVFRPDGKVMATVGDDRNIIFWEMSDPYHPAELGRVTAANGPTHMMEFSRDGRTLATASWDGTARLFDVSDPRKPVERSRITGHVDQVQAAVLTADARTLVTSGKDSKIIVWDVSGGEPRQVRTITGHTDLVHAIALSPDGTVIGSASWDTTAKLFDLATGAELAVMPSKGGISVNGVAFSPDGRTVAVSDNGGGLRLWDISDRRAPVLLSDTEAHDLNAHSIVFSPDGRTLLTGGTDKKVKLWDVHDPRQIRLLVTLPGHADTVWSAGFSPDSGKIVTTGTEGVRITDLSNVAVPHHSGTVWNIRFDPRNRYAATASADGTLRIWRPEDLTMKEITRLPGDQTETVLAVPDPSGDLLATSNLTSITGELQLWSMRDPAKPELLAELDTHRSWVNMVAFDRTGKIMATVDFDTVVRLWDVRDPRAPRELGEYKTNSLNLPQHLEFTDDGRTLAVASGSAELYLFDISNPAAIRPYPAIHSGDRGPSSGRRSEINGLALHGSVLAVANVDRVVALYDIARPDQPKKIASLPDNGSSVVRLAFSPDGTSLVTAQADNLVQVWDVRDPFHPLLRAKLSGHTSRLWAVAFAPDNRTLATAGTDMAIRMWNIDVEDTARRVCRFTGPHLSSQQWEQYFPGVPQRALC